MKTIKDYIQEAKHSFHIKSHLKKNDYDLKNAKWFYIIYDMYRPGADKSKISFLKSFSKEEYENLVKTLETEYESYEFPEGLDDYFGGWKPEVLLENIRTLDKREVEEKTKV